MQIQHDSYFVNSNLSAKEIQKYKL